MFRRAIAAVAQFHNYVRFLSSSGCFLMVCALTLLPAAHADEIEIRTIPQQLPLPQTYDMKFAGDVSSYIRLKCSGFAAQCDVFVQGNRKGSLIGYLFIRQESDGSVYFESDTWTNDERVCVILGNFDGAHFNAIDNFERRSAFQANTAARNKGDKGGYLITRAGEHLRVQDDKWNYCYETKTIDDVWNLLGTARRH